MNTKKHLECFRVFRPSKTPRRAREGRSPFALESWSAACTATTELILLCKIASLQILRPESEGFKQNLEGGVAGEFAPPSTRLSKFFFDKLNIWNASGCFLLYGRRPAARPSKPNGAASPGCISQARGQFRVTRAYGSWCSGFPCTSASCPCTSARPPAASIPFG